MKQSTGPAKTGYPAQWRRRFSVLLAGGVAAAVLAGCGGGGGGGSVTLTHGQAVSRAEHLVNETVAVLTPRPKLTLYPSLSGDTNCVNSIGGQSNLVNVSRSYILDGPPASGDQTAGSRIKSFWQKQGYHITRSDGLGTATPNISAKTSDDFLLVLESNSAGTLMLVASSPCAQPAGSA
jgi:hypothetical protein